jgi:hypothetical protein
MHENKIMYSAAKGGMGDERIIKGMDLIKMCYMPEWKYHNATPFVPLRYD